MIKTICNKLISIINKQTRAYLNSFITPAGVANSKFKTLQDGEMIVFLYEPEALSIFQLQGRALTVF